VAEKIALVMAGVAAAMGGSPRPVIYFSERPGDIDILGVLHSSMDPDIHLG
jgi:hypothetical protein